MIRSAACRALDYARVQVTLHCRRGPSAEVLPLEARDAVTLAGRQTGRDSEPTEAQAGDLRSAATGLVISLDPAKSLGLSSPANAICALATENSYKTFPAVFAIAINGKLGD